MARKLAIKTKHDREAEKQRVKTLYYAGQTLADAARAVGVTGDVARQWAVRGGWTKEIQGVKQLVQNLSPGVTPDINIAFDLAKTNKESRAALARGLHRAAKHIDEKMLPEDMIDAGPQVKAIVGSIAQVAGDWEDASQGSKLAIAINIGAMASDPKRMRVLLPEELQDLRNQGHDV